jgi:hypothetical protein
VAVLALIVYVATLAPGLTFENNGTDGGDLITAAWTLGVPHPPGYPTFTLLAWLATRLPVGTIAYRVNLLSAVSAALAVGLFCRSLQLLLHAEKHAAPLSVATALTFGFSSLFWSQAVIAEVYTLLLLFAAILLWLLLGWRRGGSDSALWLASLVLGLGLGNHLTLFFIAPAALVLLWPEHKRLIRIRTLLPAAVLFLLGLSIYAYLPLAAHHRPAINWGNPQTWKGFLWVVTADQYQSFVFGLPLEQVPERIGAWAGQFGDQFGWWGLAIALVGACWWWQRDRRFLAFMLTWMLPLSVYAFFYDTGDSHVYLLPVMMLMALWWAGGACYLLSLVEKRVPRRAWLQLTLVVILLLPLGSLALHWHQVDLSDDWQAYAYAYQALKGVDPGSLIVVRGDRPTFALWYGVYAEGQRTDVSIVSGPMLAFIWYRDHIRHMYPHLVVPEPTAAKVTIDDLVRELITQNLTRMPVYVTDPSEPWKEWFAFTKKDAPIYQVSLKSRWEQGQ